MSVQGWEEKTGVNGEKYWTRMLWAGVMSQQSSEWIPCGGLDRIRIQITGISGDTVKVQSALFATPQTLVPGTDYIEEIALTADGMVLLIGPYEAFKVECTTYSAGVLVALAEGF